MAVIVVVALLLIVPQPAGARPPSPPVAADLLVQAATGSGGLTSLKAAVDETSSSDTSPDTSSSDTTSPGEATTDSTVPDTTTDTTAPETTTTDTVPPETTTTTAPVDTAPPLAVGESASFWACDWATNVYYRLTATARYVGPHVAVYVDDNQRVSNYEVDRLGSEFETVIYPTLTAAFGAPPIPGQDGDPRIVILLYDFNDPLDDVDGAFYTWDIDPDGTLYSNQREMFYLNTAALIAEPGSAPALAAHEFTHLILHYQDRMLDPSPAGTSEAIWVVEGLTTYGEHLCGYNQRVGSQLRAFARDPNIGLTLWRGIKANYGASYSFMTYLAERQGAAFIRALVRQPLDGAPGIDATLAATGSSASFASLFDDWVAANFLDSRSPQCAPYYFSELAVSIEPTGISGVPPLLGRADVVDFGAVYIDFPAASPAASFQVVVDGEGPLQAALISWDSRGEREPVVERIDLDNAAVGGTRNSVLGYDRHTLAVWARSIPGSGESYGFTYSGTTNPPKGVQFLDMGGSDPFYKYVGVLLDRGIVNGREVPPGSGLWFFKGSDQVLRAQFAKMIVETIERHTEQIDNAGSPTFKDVPAVYDANGYPFDYVEEAFALGIVTGYKDGRYFGPYDPITRGQLVVMIWRGAEAAGTPLPGYQGNAKVFADVPPSHPYYRYIMAAYTVGILQGSQGPDGKLYFYPGATASRNHVAKMTANLLAYLALR
jgi:hypothetical protein